MSHACHLAVRDPRCPQRRPRHECGRHLAGGGVNSNTEMSLEGRAMFRAWGRVGKFVETVGDDAAGAFGGQVVMGTMRASTKGSGVIRAASSRKRKPKSSRLAPPFRRAWKPA